MPTIHREDAVLLNSFTELDHPRVDSWTMSLTSLLDPAPFILGAVVLVAFAVARNRPRLALAVIASLSLAPLTTEVLKPLVAHSHAQIGLGQHVPPASWPSGHSAAALSFALCAALVVPRRLRIAVAVAGGAFAIAVGASQLILGRHMPSDVVGGYLVAILWTTLCVAALRVARTEPYCCSE